MKFLKLLESRLPTSVTEDTIIFTETGKIFVNDSTGELIQMAGAEGTGGTGIPVISQLPEVTVPAGTTYILNRTPPKMVTYVNGAWWQTPMVPYVDEENIMLTLSNDGKAELEHPEVLKPEGVYSFSTRVRPTYETQYSYVVGSGAETTSRRRGIALVITSSDTMYVGVKNNDKKAVTGYFSFTRATVLDIVAVFDLTNLYVYINGTLVSTAAATTNTDIEDSTVNYTAYIGGPSSGSSNTFQGSIEHLAIYNRVLTQEDVTALRTQSPDVISGVIHYWPMRDNASTLTDIVGAEVANLSGDYSWTIRPTV